MRAREFITEQEKLPTEQSAPMGHTFIIPGLGSDNSYPTYRFGVAMARARSDAGTDEINLKLPPWSAETAIGRHAVVAGFDDDIDTIIDQALAMTNTPGGKRLISTDTSQEPDFVLTTSPVQAFKGYPR